jgi:hypothetical protein
VIEQMQARLAELRGEYRQGEERLRDLTREEVVLREVLLRISGAIQVLEELTAVTSEGGGEDGSHAPADGNGTGARPEVLTVP